MLKLIVVPPQNSVRIIRPSDDKNYRKTQEVGGGGGGGGGARGALKAFFLCSALFLRCKNINR